MHGWYCEGQKNPRLFLADKALALRRCIEWLRTGIGARDR